MTAGDDNPQEPEQRGSRSSNVLLLGISYPDVREHMKRHGFKGDLLTHATPSVDQAVECVRRGILTEMDARDYARCVATEEATSSNVYTVSMEIGAVYREDRHLHGNFNARSFVQQVRSTFGEDVKFSQIVLDYYWMPTGWLVTRWAKTLFQKTLPDLVRYNLLQYPSSQRGQSNGSTTSSASNDTDASTSTTLASDTSSEPMDVGVVYLPFCAHCCKEVVGAIDILKEYYAIDFITKTQLPGHSLWKGTMQIDGNIMQTRLGKRLDQEEVYCTFKPKDIYESMEDSHVSKPAVMKVLLRIPNYDDIRMIRLRPLRQHAPLTPMQEPPEPEKGGFKGLLDKPPRDWTRTGRVKARKPPPRRKGTTIRRRRKNKETPFKDLRNQQPSKVEEVEEIPAKVWSQRRKQIHKRRLAFFGEDIEDEDVPPVTVFYPQPAVDLLTYLNPEDCVADDRNELQELAIDEERLKRRKRKLGATKKVKPQKFARQTSEQTIGEFLQSNPRVSNERVRRSIFNDEITTNLNGMSHLFDHGPTFLEGACILFEMANKPRENAMKLDSMARENMGRAEIVCYGIPRSAILRRLYQPLTKKSSDHEAKRHNEGEDTSTIPHNRLSGRRKKSSLSSKPEDITLNVVDLCSPKIASSSLFKRGEAENWKAYLSSDDLLQLRQMKLAFLEDERVAILRDWKQSDHAPQSGSREAEVDFECSHLKRELDEIECVECQYDLNSAAPAYCSVSSSTRRINGSRLHPNGTDNELEFGCGKSDPEDLKLYPFYNYLLLGHESESLQSTDDAVNCVSDYGSDTCMAECSALENRVDEGLDGTNPPGTKAAQNKEKAVWFDNFRTVVLNRWRMLDYATRWLVFSKLDTLDPTNGNFKAVDSKITSTFHSVVYHATLIERELYRESTRAKWEAKRAVKRRVPSAIRHSQGSTANEETYRFRNLASVAETELEFLKTEELDDEACVNELVSLGELPENRAPLVKKISLWLRGADKITYSTTEEEEFANVYSIVQLNENLSVVEKALEMEHKLHELRQIIGPRWLDQIVEKEIAKHELILRRFAKRFGADRKETLENACIWLSDPTADNDPKGEFRLASLLIPDSGNNSFIERGMEIEGAVHRQRAVWGSDWASTSTLSEIMKRRQNREWITSGFLRTNEPHGTVVSQVSSTSSFLTTNLPHGTVVSPEVSSTSSFTTTADDDFEDCVVCVSPTPPSSEDGSRRSDLSGGFGWVQVQKVCCNGRNDHSTAKAC